MQNQHSGLIGKIEIPALVDHLMVHLKCGKLSSLEGPRMRLRARSHKHVLHVASGRRLL